MSRRGHNVFGPITAVACRVYFETSFDSKQPKLEPKQVLALSETKRLFRLFRFYSETESFDVSIEPKQPKQFFRIVLVCFGLFRNSSIRFFRFYIETENLGLFLFVSKQFYRNTETHETHETNQNTTETDLVSVRFVSNRNFVCLFDTQVAC